MPDDYLNMQGYHGTLADRADSIIANGFNRSSKEIEWLGFGVYFFDSFSNAKAWAIQEHDRQKGDASPPVVLAVTIRTLKSDFLDLDERSTMRSFEKELKRGYQAMFGSGNGGAPNFKDKRELRCFWCNFYTKIHPNIKVIAFTFHRIQCNEFGFRLVYGQRQLCVVDSACIGMPPKRSEVVQ